MAAEGWILPPAIPDLGNTPTVTGSAGMHVVGQDYKDPKSQYGGRSTVHSGCLRTNTGEGRSKCIVYNINKD